METMNDFAVGMLGDDRFVLANPPRAPFTREQALRLAAWLVAVSEYVPAQTTPLSPSFAEILAAVLAT